MTFHAKFRFSMSAAAACAAGAGVSLWLTGEAAWWAVPGKGPDLGLEHARPVEDLLAIILDMGEVTLCSQCAERRGITADTAMRLARYFRISAQFWMNLQSHYELEVAEEANGQRLDAEVRPHAA